MTKTTEYREYRPELNHEGLLTITRPEPHPWIEWAISLTAGAEWLLSPKGATS